MKLITGYGDYSAEDLMMLGGKVAANLVLLAIFATLKPTPAQITAAVQALEAALQMVGPGRAQAVEAAFNALAGLLAQVAMNAPQVAGVTDTDLAAIGLPIVETPTRATTVPDAPQDLELHNGPMQGEVRGSCKSMGRTIRGFESQWTLDPNAGPWTDGGQFPNSRAFRWTGLTRGKDTWFRVAAINSIGQGPWSDPATIMVT
jgi:hypothetical protein